MFIDASAMVAIIAGEPDAAELSARLGRAAQAYTSPVAIYEAVLGVARAGAMHVRQAEGLLDDFVGELTITVVPITASIGRAAVCAFDRFGRGRHPAGLNMGDCFAYACARELSVPLLFKGSDFPQTDIEAA
jgi:ribonuclease VapC